MKSTSHKAMGIALIILVLGGLALIYKSQRPQRPPIANAGWNLYVNNKYDFSFEYPSSADVTQKNVSHQPGDIYAIPNVDGQLAQVHVYTASEYQKWQSFWYEKLTTLNKDFAGYQNSTSENDPSVKYAEGDAASLKYIEQKMTIGGNPALDLIHCGGGDGCSRTVYLLKGSLVIELSHNKGYLKYEHYVKDGVISPNFVYAVRPLQRIDETTDFDRLLSSFKFAK